MAKKKVKEAVKKTPVKKTKNAAKKETATPVNRMAAIETLEVLAVSAIRPTPDNPRHINEKDPKFLELVESVKARGVVVPIHVRYLPDSPATNRPATDYELLAGERRLRATRAAKLSTIRAINHGQISDEEAFEITFAENFNRQDLTPLEEARACATLLEKYNGDTKAVASKMGRSTTWVRTRANIQDGLSAAWKEAVENPNDHDGFKDITAAHLAAVAKFPVDTQDLILERLWESDMESVAAFEDKCAQFLRLLNKAPWELNEEVELGKKTIRCSICPKRSSAQPGLWEAEGSDNNDRCLDPSCWEDRVMLHLVERHKQLKKDHPKIIAAVSDSNMNYQKIEECKKLFGRILRTYEYDKLVKTKADNALPVMVLDGPDAGQLRWAKVRSQESDTRGQNKQESEAVQKEKKILAAWRDYVVRLQAAVEAAALADLKSNENLSTDEVLLSLTAAFGCSYVMNSGEDDETDSMGDLDKRLDGNTKLLGTLREDIWRTLKDAIAESFSFIYGVSVIEATAERAAVISALIGFKEPMPELPEDLTTESTEDTESEDGDESDLSDDEN